MQWRDVAADRGVPEWVLDILETEAFHVVFGKIAVLTEIGIGLGLTFRKTRIAALWVAVWFHISIEIVASVQVFSYAALAALVIWVTPRGRDRVVELRGEGRAASSLGWALRRLDWTGRFRIVRPDDPGPGITLLDRGEARREGAAATRMVLSRLPMTFPLAAPLLIGAGIKGRRRRVSRPSPRAKQR